MNIVKFLRTPTLKNICERIFLWLGFTNVTLNVACVLFVIEKQRVVYLSAFFLYSLLTVSLYSVFHQSVRVLFQKYADFET